MSGIAASPWTVAGLLDLSAPLAGQIKFPATQNPSSDANTLDDYEEGSWTPSLGGTATYTVQSAIYTKIGNFVFVRGQISVNAIGSGNTGIFSGLPFASGGVTGGSIAFFAGSATAVYFITCYANSTSIHVVGTAAASAASTDPIVFFQNSASLYFSCGYSL